tara:strand:- start:3092 stop:4222 length:1131 start_codon:yes stop_codon:yes gene_type:complete
VIKNASKTNLIFIRVDSSSQIGSGHVERCLTLAKELRERGMEISFISRAHIGNFKNQIKNAGFKIFMLPLNNNSIKKNDHKSWLGVKWQKDAKDTIKILSKKKLMLLIVDHYAIDINWENYVKLLTGVKIMVIDGLANRRHNCEILLDYTYSQKGKKRWDKLIPSNCMLLQGTKYILLRSEFVQAKKNLYTRKGEIKRILIAFGGSKNKNATMTALNALLSLKKDKVFVDVVVSKNFEDINMVKKICNIKENTKLHVQSSNIAYLMSKADLSIGAGGTMLWERCYLGLPSLIISTANNQIKQSLAIHSYGAAIYLGSYKKNIKQKLLEQLSILFKNKKLNSLMSQKSFELMEISRKKNNNSNPTKFLCNTLLKKMK